MAILPASQRAAQALRALRARPAFTALAVFTLALGIAASTVLPEELEFGAAPVVLLGHGFWLERLGGDPGIVGSTVELAGKPHTVIGVAPPGIDFPGHARLWLPRALDPEECGRGCHFLEVLARPQPAGR